ncbi:TonB-dependent receptor plug domain-containing protein [Lysobacter enzymogenes]|uniref:TonB-dependent receptor plug domain-containing protein n=1 Tax=Lysobacter enzymogenes TaxID=69 RepID=UPI001F0CC533|nr:TonB-dependent receptor [Lysobacter enzymogenes]
MILPNAGLALAQDVATDKDAKPSAEAPASNNATSLETVTVTGSRIGRDTFTSVSPLQVITREETTLAGFNSAAGALQSNAVTGGSAQINNAYGGFVVNGGGGTNTLGLRGMDPTRTLILLNGRRVSPAGSRGSVGSADLNVLPTSMIDRVEVLKDGASSIYGSDAVAGVVNIITRKNIDGLSVEAQYNVSEAGGGDETRYSISWGKTSDRFSISGSFEAYDRNELKLGDRDWARCQTPYVRTVDDATGAVGAWGSDDFIDPLTGKTKCYQLAGRGSNGVTINTISTGTRTGVGAAGSVGSSFNRWRPNSGVTTGLVGFEGVGGGLNDLNVRDTFDPRQLNNSMISPVQVKTGFVQGAFDLQALGNAEVYFELLGNRRESDQTGFRQLSLDYARGSILLPTQLQSSVAQTAPTNLTNGQPLGVRAFIGAGNDHSEQTVDFWKITGGLRGDFVWTDWHYDFMVSKARSDADYTFEGFRIDKLAQSLDVVAAPGGFACRNAAGGCVAAPFLTSQVIGGKLPQDWRNFVYGRATGSTLYEESTVNFSLDGPLFSLPYGEVRGAFGLEYRRAKINDQPAPDSLTNNIQNFTSAAPTVGKDSVKEIYGELEVPLLSGLKGAEELTMNVSARYTDYDSYGSDHTYKIGGLWTPVSWLTFRASYGTSYRAPALFEQFLGGTTGFLSSATDPCDDLSPNDSPVRRANCATEVPADFRATSGVTSITAGGAEQGLKAETSKNFTTGIVLQPELPKSFGDLSFAVDYYKIEVENGVSRIGGAEILSRCYTDPQFRNGGSFCRLVDPRAPGNGALTVHDSYINLATDRVRGLDFTARYVRDIGPGTLRTTVQATHFLEQSSKLFPEDELEDFNGNIGVPSWSATLDATYEWKNWKVRYGLEWVDSMQSYGYYELDRATSPYKMHTEDYYLSHLSVQHKWDKWSVTGGVRNLFDAEPKKISDSDKYYRVGNAPLYSGYDYLGRSFFLNVQASF